MRSIRRIVVGTDLSASAGDAVERAAQLARSLEASLTLVHAVASSAWDDLRRLLTDEDVAEGNALAEARQRVEQVASTLAGAHGIKVEEHVGTGHAVQEIAAVADEARADLVVCGSRGGGLAQRLVGSVAERVVRTSFRPVLLVKRPPRAPYGRVLVPVDFSPWSETSIRTALEVAPDAHQVLLHAVDTSWIRREWPDQVDKALIERYRDKATLEAQERLIELAGRAGLASGTWSASITLDVDPWTAILQQAWTQACDLVAIGKQGRSALGEFLLGSVTHKVIAESESDVLIAARGETIVFRARDRTDSSATALPSSPP